MPRKKGSNDKKFVEMYGKDYVQPTLVSEKDQWGLDLDFAVEDIKLHEDPVYLSLQPQQRRFVYMLYVQEVRGWTNSRTYKEAYQRPDMPNRTGSLRYNEVMKNEKIKHCRIQIMKHIQRLLDRIPRRVIREECAIAFADIAEYFDHEGHLTQHPSKLPPKVRAAIAGIKCTHQKNGSTVYEVSLWNKGASLSRLQSMFGMNSPTKTEVSGPGGLPIQTENKNINYDITLLSDDDKLALKKLLDKCRVDDA